MFFLSYPPAGVLLMLTALLNLSLAGYIYWKREKNSSRILLSIFCLLFSLWCFAISLGSINPTLWGLFAVRMAFAVCAPLPLVILLFSYSFPKEKLNFPIPAAVLLTIPVLIILTLIPSNLILDPIVTPEGMLLRLGPLNFIYTLYFSLFLWALVVLFIKFLKASRIEKTRYKYFFLGIFLTSLIGILFNLVLVSIFNISRFVYFGPLGSLFLTTLTTYAILKYRLMDISLAIKKTTAYSLITTAITFTYVFVVLAFEFLFRSIWGYYSFWAAVPAAFVIAVTFVPVRERLQKITDRIFFRRIVEYQNIIREVTRLIVSVTHLSTLFRLIDRTIVRAMCVKNVAILLLEEKESQFLVEKTNGLSANVLNIKLSLKGPLVSYLEEKKDGVVLDEVKALLASDTTSSQKKERLKAVCATLESFDAVIAFPSFIKEKLVGILCLGEKLSGEPYSPDDLELLLTMASEAGIAIENAKLYRDITETRDYLNNLVQGSDDAIFTLDLDGKVLTWNKGAETILRYSSSGVVGKSPPIFTEDEIKDLINKVLRGEMVRAVEIKKKDKHGKEKPFLLTLSAIRDQTYKTIGISGILKDITELRKADQFKHEFLSVVSHELRTPLTPIKGYLSMLLSKKFGNLKQKQTDILKIILDQSNHLRDLVESVIDISRTEAGKSLELEEEPIFLDELIKESIKFAEQTFAIRNIKVQTNYSSTPIALMGDRKKLLRVMDNLLGNALKFTPLKGLIKVTLEKDEKQIKVSVKDSGIGIAPENIEKIFERLYQIDTSYTRTTGGIGMGLAISCGIVEAHGGRIWVESEGLGKGSNFIFTLPI